MTSLQVRPSYGKAFGLILKTYICDAFWHLRLRPKHPNLFGVFNRLKGGDPMSSDFVFQSVASADCLCEGQPLR